VVNKKKKRRAADVDPAANVIIAREAVEIASQDADAELTASALIAREAVAKRASQDVDAEQAVSVRIAKETAERKLDADVEIARLGVDVELTASALTARVGAERRLKDSADNGANVEAPALAKWCALV